MQFKTLAFLSILSILLFIGCDSKDENENPKENSTETTIEKVEKKSEFQLKTTNETIINLKLENGKIVLKDYLVLFDHLLFFL